MEGFRDRATFRATGTALILAAVLVLALVASPASAKLRRTTSRARSDSAGVSYSIRQTTSDGGSSSGAAAGVSCDYELSLGNIGVYSGYWKDSPSETSVLARRVCTDGTDGFVWVDGCDFMDLDRICPQGASPRVDPIVLARRVRDRLPVPDFEIASNPARGLVGLRSWFWIEGGGRSLSDSLSAFGARVDVEARPTTYRWDFGDGTTKATRSAGRPYPRRSPVRHIYQRSSAELARGYRVSVSTSFDVRWRTNGRRWRSLPAISRLSSRYYRVAESQAVNSDG
jgi:hypothetical protein